MEDSVVPFPVEALTEGPNGTGSQSTMFPNSRLYRPGRSMFPGNPPRVINQPTGFGPEEGPMYDWGSNVRWERHVNGTHVVFSPCDEGKNPSLNYVGSVKFLGP